MTDEELRALLQSTAADTRRHFDVSTESVRREVQIVAEAVTRSDEKLQALRQEMLRGFSDTQSMIEFSHAELDRRIRTLEDSHRELSDTVADLQLRIERLESSPHRFCNERLVPMPQRTTRADRTQEVVGSIPISSTNLKSEIRRQKAEMLSDVVLSH